MSGDRFVFKDTEVHDGFWRNNDAGICCWLDTEPFDGPVYSYPIRKENNKWTVCGVFCSLHCVKRYIIENCFMNNSVFTLFSLMCIQVYKHNGNVAPAPQSHLLRKFSITGKGLSIVDFRAAGKGGVVIRAVQPPIYPFKFEEGYVCSQSIACGTGLSSTAAVATVMDPDPNDGVSLGSGENIAHDLPMFPSRNLHTLGNFYEARSDDTRV